MLFLIVLAFALLGVRAAGGRYGRLAELPVRRPSLVVVALALQIVTISVLTRLPHPLAAALHLLSYGLAALFLWVNRRLRGLPLIVLGGGLNLAAIVANGGTMPARPGALRTAGIVQDGAHFANSTMVARPHLALLGDVVAVPHSAGPLLANVFSVGDCVLAAGMVWLLHAAAGCPWAQPRPPRSARARPGTSSVSSPAPR